MWRTLASALRAVRAACTLSAWSLSSSSLRTQWRASFAMPIAQSSILISLAVIIFILRFDFSERALGLFAPLRNRACPQHQNRQEHERSQRAKRPLGVPPKDPEDSR